MNDLIYALATPVGGAIAVVRLSGAGADALLHAIFTGRGGPREMVYGRVVDEAGETLDQAMAAFFPAPRSYTGEDMRSFTFMGGRLRCGGCWRCWAAMPAARGRANSPSARSLRASSTLHRLKP